MSELDVRNLASGGVESYKRGVGSIGDAVLVHGEVAGLYLSSDDIDGIALTGVAENVVCPPHGNVLRCELVAVRKGENNQSRNKGDNHADYYFFDSRGR